ncbi:MAG TPA: serine hydrolase [Patescibacteria group bacterium]|nr:serine hydrolase [Patescibacteria group bacterium]
MSKILLVVSILFNTLGFSGAAQKVDTNYISQIAGSAQTADASAPFAPLPDILPYPTIRKNAVSPKIYAQNYLLIDNDSGVLLAVQKPYEQVPVASTTKIMTAVLVLENYKLDDIVIISQNAISTVSKSGAIPDFRLGEQMTVRNLLRCMLINSSNVAAYALAEHLNGIGETGITKFVAKMNEKAKDFGMKDTNYQDPAGLDSTGYSSAYDLSVVTKQALKNEIFADIVKTREASVTDVIGRIVHQLNNSNRLVKEWNYPGAIGVKTGYMPDTPDQPGAGHTLVAAVERNGHILISVILNTTANTPSASAEESRKLQDWGWTNTIWE